METTQPKKKNTALIIIGIVGGSCLLLVIAGVLMIGAIGRFTSGMLDPEVAAETGHAIADYDLPSGYSEQISMNIPGYQFVTIMSTSKPSSPMIMLAQFSQNTTMSTEEMQRQMAQSSGSQAGVQMHVVETSTMTIRGAESEVVISEGVYQGGQSIRQLMTMFPGKGGQALLMIQGMTGDWDEQAIDAFISSIR